MIVAVAVENGNVCQHFGHSPSFSFYELDGSKIISEKNIASPGHGYGIIPEFIASNGASVVIVGGMGQGAINACLQHNIEIITGIEGKASDIADLFAKGMLTSSSSICSHHHNREVHACCTGKCSG